tara:strand:+ start:1441 stop:2661 length:1221 start_codon:yes stop_codon:yes gene_type:complete
MTQIFDKKLGLIIFFGIILRLISIYYFADTKIDNEWDIMLYNLEHNKILSVRSIDGVAVPNIFMPPLYPLFLYLVKSLIVDAEFFLNTIFIIQLFFSLISIILIYKILLKIFDSNLSYIGTIIFTIFPLNVFAVAQVSSIILQMLLINFFLFSFVSLIKKIKYKYIYLFSLSSALLILLRGEFFIFVIFSLFFLFLMKKEVKSLLLTAMLVLLLVSPYLYRNYNLFGVITITKSSGYNLLKGNHPRTVVGGIGMFNEVENVIPEVKQELEELYKKGPIKNHDLLKDKILLNQALSFIKDNPTKYAELYLKKFFSFAFIDFNSSYPNYYSLYHLLPKILLSISSIIGLILIINFGINISNYFALFYLGNLGLFSFFFILPRYSLSLLTVQIILSLFGVGKLLNKSKL